MPNSNNKVFPLPVGEVIKALSFVLYNKSKHSSWTLFKVGKLIIDDNGYCFIRLYIGCLKKSFSLIFFLDDEWEDSISLPKAACKSWEFIISKSLFLFVLFSLFNSLFFSK